MYATDLTTLVSLVGMTLLRIGVPILAMGLLSAVLKRVAPEAFENDRAGVHHMFAVDCSASQPSKQLMDPSGP